LISLFTFKENNKLHVSENKGPKKISAPKMNVVGNLGYYIVKNLAVYLGHLNRAVTPGEFTGLVI
jgi:hypothetical protein